MKFYVLIIMVLVLYIMNMPYFSKYENFYSRKPEKTTKKPTTTTQTTNIAVSKKTGSNTNFLGKSLYESCNLPLEFCQNGLYCSSNKKLCRRTGFDGTRGSKCIDTKDCNDNLICKHNAKTKFLKTCQ